MIENINKSEKPILKDIFLFYMINIYLLIFWDSRLSKNMLNFCWKGAKSFK